MRGREISLKTRLIISMILLSLLSIATVGFFAHEQMVRRFDKGITEDAGKHFSAGVSLYLQTYGSWEIAANKENLIEFLHARKAQLITHHDDEDRLFHMAGMQSTEDEHLHEAPPNIFQHFYVFDTQFRSQLDLPPYHKGEMVHREHRDALIPITSHQQIVAYYTFATDIPLPEIDQAYMMLIRQALFIGAAVAAILALLIGSFISIRLVRSLERLTLAVDAMDQGQLKQFVDHASNDEIGRLAQAFNRMSERLYLADKDIRDSHQQIAEQAKLLKEQSLRDPLTTLYNRRYIDQIGSKHFEQQIRHGHPFCVMIGDIDFFKSINDQFSHAVGDEVLQEIAHILRQHSTDTDMIARYGGEEFVILFPSTTLPKAKYCCEQIRTAIAQHDWRAIHPLLQVTISMGVASHDQESTLSALIRLADTRLYSAKANGRNQVIAQ